MLIDTHTHLYTEQFNKDRDKVIQNAIDAGVEKFFLPNIDLDSIDGMHQLVKKYPNNCYAMMGLHPSSVDANYKEVLDKMKSFLDDNNYIAVGEIGMDLYWDKTFINEQADALKIQIQWAKEKKLPIVIHVRDAFDEIFEVIDPLNDKNLFGVFHCFTGNIDQAHKIINYGGFKLGIGGVLTFKNSGLDKVVSQIDLKHLVLETDSPYLAPAPHRGKRNESSYVNIVADKLVDVLQKDRQIIIEETTKNVQQIFKQLH
ncbi:MAG TPA: TatD family deoxyribonuclease [Crocinitomix sp.]|nr:TatD family deoxyribonuclease [Crocinitomix sp.]